MAPLLPRNLYMEEFEISPIYIYKRRKPENTILYQTVLNHLDEYIMEAGDVPSYVITAFRKYLACGILAHGFARAWCKECGLDFLIAFSCKQRGACPSCNTKYMVQTSAHIVDNVLPRVNYRQWVLAVPKRIRYFLYKEPHHAGKILRLFHTDIERLIREKCINKAEDGRIGAVSFIQRFGAFINVHVHYHSIVTDGIFTEDESGELNFQKAAEITDDDVNLLVEKVRKKVIKYMVRQNLIDPIDAKDMLRWEHNGGFSIDCKVKIDKDSRLGLEKLLRYCSRPPLLLSRLHKDENGTIIYRLPDKEIYDQSFIPLKPLELIQKVAEIIPPPYVHRHVYYGVLAPNAKLRKRVVLTAGSDDAGSNVMNDSMNKMNTTPNTERNESKDNNEKTSATKKRACSLWAIMIARIFEVMPLICTRCGKPMKIISFLTEKDTIEHILNHIGEPSIPPHPTRSPPEEIFEQHPEYIN